MVPHRPDDARHPVRREADRILPTGGRRDGGQGADEADALMSWIRLAASMPASTSDPEMESSSFQLRFFRFACLSMCTGSRGSWNQVLACFFSVAGSAPLEASRGTAASPSCGLLADSSKPGLHFLSSRRVAVLGCRLGVRSCRRGATLFDWLSECFGVQVGTDCGIRLLSPRPGYGWRLQRRRGECPSPARTLSCQRCRLRS